MSVEYVIHVRPSVQNTILLGPFIRGQDAQVRDVGLLFVYINRAGKCTFKAIIVLQPTLTLMMFIP